MICKPTLEEITKKSKDNKNNKYYIETITEIGNILHSKLILDYENTILKLTLLEREQEEQIQLAKRSEIDLEYLENQKKYLTEIGNLKKEYNEQKESTATRIKELTKNTANLKMETIAVSGSYNGIVKMVNIYEKKCVEYETKLKYAQEFLPRLNTLLDKSVNQTEENE